MAGGNRYDDFPPPARAMIKLQLPSQGPSWLTAFARSIETAFRSTMPAPFRLKSYTVATLPDAAVAGAGAIIHVADESGGAVPAYSDGSAWRRVNDRGLVS